MTTYRLRVYEPGDRLSETHDIFAEDDATAKCLAQQKFNELAAELPTLERFGLYDGDRLVCEIVSGHG